MAKKKKKSTGSIGSDWPGPRRPLAGARAGRMTLKKLAAMTVEALMDLRKRVDEMLLERRAELEKQLERIAVVGGRRIVRGGGSALKGRKVPPNRGARPRWLVAGIKGGKKLDDFLIDKSARKGRRKNAA